MTRTIIFAVILTMFCAGCSNFKIKDGNELTISSNNEKINISSGESTQISSSISSNNREDNKIPKKYIDFIEGKNHIDEILFYAEEDIDLDGNEEAIIALGSSYEEPSETNFSLIYILRDSNGEIKQLGDNLAEGGGYGVYEIKLITLQNMSKKYIYCGLTNGAQMTGFEIYELIQNKPNSICYSASASGVGDDELRDFDDDGHFDGYVQNRSSYDVLNYMLCRTYVWNGSEFVLKYTYVDTMEYPDNIKDVILQYMDLRVLDAEKSPEVDKRLSELCIYNKATDIDISLDIWYFYNITDELEFVIDEHNNDAKVTVSCKDDSDNKYKYKFHLIKLDNRWCIDNIE